MKNKCAVCGGPMAFDDLIYASPTCDPGHFLCWRDRTAGAVEELAEMYARQERFREHVVWTVAAP